MLKDQLQSFLDGTGPMPPIIDLAMSGQYMMGRIWFATLCVIIYSFYILSKKMYKNPDLIHDANTGPIIVLSLGAMLTLGVVAVVQVCTTLSIAIDPGNFAIAWYKSHKF